METFEFLGFRATFASAASMALLERVRRLADFPAAVLILGESGSGKEMVARALHCYSRRAQKPWVDVSCAALPEHLIESELFGYERGAFSGADSSKPGLFEMANTGTLFLDEIGELPPKLQVKLLRVLDTKTYFRLGGTRRVQVDVRVVAATNQDLSGAIERGLFRRELYHRLAQVRIEVPPLRSRPADVTVLAEMFLKEYAPNAAFEPDAMAALVAYDWPGNVRELRNAVIAAAASMDGDSVLRSDLPLEVSAATSATTDLGALIRAAGLPVDDGPVNEDQFGLGLLERLEREAIRDTLTKMDGHHERTARALGISSRTLSRKLKAFQMEVNG